MSDIKQGYQSFEEVNPGICLKQNANLQPLSNALFRLNMVLESHVNPVFVVTILAVILFMWISSFDNVFRSIIYFLIFDFVDNAANRTVAEFTAGTILLIIFGILALILYLLIGFIGQTMQIWILKTRGTWLKVPVVQIKQNFETQTDRKTRSGKHFEVLEVKYMITDPKSGRQHQHTLLLRTDIEESQTKSNQICGIAFEASRPWMAVLYVNRWLYAIR